MILMLEKERAVGSCGMDISVCSFNFEALNLSSGLCGLTIYPLLASKSKNDNATLMNNKTVI